MHAAIAADEKTGACSESGGKDDGAGIVFKESAAGRKDRSRKGRKDPPRTQRRKKKKKSSLRSLRFLANFA
jgi:hypothetical protein